MDNLVIITLGTHSSGYCPGFPPDSLLSLKVISLSLPTLRLYETITPTKLQFFNLPANKFTIFSNIICKIFIIFVAVVATEGFHHDLFETPS